MARPSRGVVADPSADAVVSLTDNTGGTPGDTIAVPTADADQFASLTAKLNEVIAVLEDYGMVS